MAYNPKDHFFHKAKKDGFVARSAYKLQDLQKKYNLIRSGDRVLDLGCAPGSWSQVTLKIIGPSGYLLGVDIKPVEIQRPANANFIQADILTLDPAQFESPFHCILSDMAPNTTGIKLRDQAQSEELCRMVLQVAQKFLKTGGHLAMKIFEGPDADLIVKEAKLMFKKVNRTKPDAVRKGSYETYIVGLSKK